MSKISTAVLAMGVLALAVGCAQQPEAQATGDKTGATTAGSSPTATTGQQPAPSATGGTAGAVPAATNVDFVKDVKPLLTANCSPCHTGGSKKGRIDIDALATNDDAKANSAELQKMANKVDQGEMPPPNAPKKISDADKTKLVALLKGAAGG